MARLSDSSTTDPAICSAVWSWKRPTVHPGCSERTIRMRVDIARDKHFSYCVFLLAHSESAVFVSGKFNVYHIYEICLLGMQILNVHQTSSARKRSYSGTINDNHIRSISFVAIVASANWHYVARCTRPGRRVPLHVKQLGGIYRL